MKTPVKLSEMVSRCARLRCPACGLGPIFRAPFKVRPSCPACGAHFQREEGYFVGALSVSVVATEFAILLVYLLCLLTVGFDERFIIKVLIPAAVLCPFAFYHHSWSIWLTIDHAFERLPRKGE